MVPESTPRATFSLAAGVAAVLFLAFAVAGSPVFFKTEVLELGDLASNALQIDNAKYGRELYGNYSRFQFNHPGPAFFYVYAAGEVILHDALGLVPTPHNAHLLTSLGLQIGFFALGLAILQSWFRSPWFLALALAGAAFHFSRMAGAFNSLWPPHVLLMPSFCFIAACSSFAAGRVKDLAVMVVAGGFLFHGHVAQPLFVGGLGLLSAFLHLRGKGLPWRALPSAIRTDGVWLPRFCAGWTTLFTLPLVIDLVRYGRESNVATIIGRFAANTKDSKSVLQSLLYFLSFGSYGTNQDEAFTRLGSASWEFFFEHWPTLFVWWLLLLAPLLLFLRERRNMSHDSARFSVCGYVVFATSAVLCVLWGLVQSGPMYHFNGFFYYGVFYFGALIGGGALLARYQPPAKAPALIATFSVAAVGFTHGFRLDAPSATDAGMDVKEGLNQVLRQGKNPRPKLLVFEHYLWPEAVAVGLDLQRRGYRFYAAHSWNFMIGRDHDVHLLGDNPLDSADVWWIGENDKTGIPIKSPLGIFTQPREVDPRGTDLGFGLKENGFRHLVSGLSTGNVTYAYVEDRALRLTFSALPATADVQLFLDAEVNPVIQVPKQRVEVWMNGRPVGNSTVGARIPVNVTIPAAVWNQRRQAWLEFRFPDAVRLRDYRRPAFENWASIRLWNLWFASSVPASAEPRPAFVLDHQPVRRTPLTEEIDPAGDRVDFTATGRGALLTNVGLSVPETTLTRINGRYATLLFRAKTATEDVQLEIVAQPYTTGAGRPPNQRCRLSFNGLLIFDSPFTEPGVIRAVVPAHLWNEKPIAMLQLELPDATEASESSPQSGLALRWLTTRPIDAKNR